MIKNLLNADEQVPASENMAPAPFTLLGADDSASVAVPLTEEPMTADFSDWNDSEKPDDWSEPAKSEEPAIVVTHFVPPSKVETIRRSGLAWTAGIVFFGSVMFTLILGWFADLLLGTSPWGIVGGIVIGSIIGFINFFRITSQIFKQ